MLSEFGLGEKHVAPNFGVVFDKLQLLRKCPRVLLFDVKETCTRSAQQLDQQSCSLFGRCHVSGVELRAREPVAQVYTVADQQDEPKICSCKANCFLSLSSPIC